MSTYVINIFGGPGSGKSTTASGLFHYMKLSGYTCELVTEYAKEAVWEGNKDLLHNQLYVFAQQHHRLWRVVNSLKKLPDSDEQDKYVITDSPLLLSLVYGQINNSVDSALESLIVSEFFKYPSLNVCLNRTKEYSMVGRLQTEKAAHKIDEVISDTLDKWSTSYHRIDGDAQAPYKIMGLLSSTDAVFGKKEGAA